LEALRLARICRRNVQLADKNADALQFRKRQGVGVRNDLIVVSTRLGFAPQDYPAR